MPRTKKSISMDVSTANALKANDLALQLLEEKDKEYLAHIKEIETRYKIQIETFKEDIKKEQEKNEISKQEILVLKNTIQKLKFKLGSVA